MRKITWWHQEITRDIHTPFIGLMRYDWPDQRIYQIGLYTPKVGWTNGNGEALQTPDYFVDIDQIIEFINIPQEREYTYVIKRRTIGE